METARLETGRVGTFAARSRHGGGTPRVDAGCVDTSIDARTRAGHTISRRLVPLRSQTGRMRLASRVLCDEPIAARAAVVAAALSVASPACPKRSGNVPAGGRTGGFQTSAPQVRPLALPDTAAASRGHDGGTVVAPDTLGPTAHLVNLVLLVPLDCCAALPNWIAQ